MSISKGIDRGELKTLVEYRLLASDNLFKMPLWWVRSPRRFGVSRRSFEMLDASSDGLAWEIGGRLGLTR